MGLNGGPWGDFTLPPAWDPVLLNLTLHAILPTTIILMCNARFQEAADIVITGNITLVFLARPVFVDKSSY